MMIATIRGARFLIHLGYGLSLAVIYPRLSTQRQRHILQQWSADLLTILNVQLKLPTDPSDDISLNGLIVANHISWLDIFVLNALLPMRFVAKSDVRAWPVLGWLSTRAQTLYIERGNARSAARINHEMTTRLKDGECFAIFPEGTTSLGVSVLDFHASLFQPAIDAKVPISPIALRYHDGLGNQDHSAAFIDDLSFVRSLWQILNTHELHVQLIPLPPLASADIDRRSLAKQAQQLITTALGSPHYALQAAVRRRFLDTHLDRFQSLFSVLLNAETTPPK